MGPAIHLDIKRAAVRLNHFFNAKETAYFLGISEDTVRRAVKQFQETGDVSAPSKGVKRGRKPILDEGDLSVSHVLRYKPSILYASLSI
jgi:transposase